MIRYKRIWIRCLEHHKTHKVEEGNGNQAIRSLPDAWEKQTGNIERGFCYDRNEIYISEAAAVCGCVGFYIGELYNKFM